MEIALPIVNPDIQHNKKVNGEMIHSRQADLDIYRRDLVQKIKQAYYQFLQTGKAVEIYTNALALARENRRVSEKFVENRMATKETVLRAQAQVSKVEASLIEAKGDLRNSVAYFNCLLNRGLDAEVVRDASLDSTATEEGSGEVLQGPGLPGGREELAKLRSYRSILQSNLQYNKNYLVPRLNAFYDVGYQGYGFHFNSDQFYQLAGLQLSWTLFKGGDNKYKIRQAEVDMASVGDQYKDLTQQLTLQAQTTSNDYHSAVEAMRPLRDEVYSARETYRLAERRFNEGLALQIELIDARTQMTEAELRCSLGRLAVLNRAADMERVMASYKF
jgi:outer membrane protein TolC